MAAISDVLREAQEYEFQGSRPVDGAPTDSHYGSRTRICCGISDKPRYSRLIHTLCEGGTCRLRAQTLSLSPLVGWELPIAATCCSSGTPRVVDQSAMARLDGECYWMPWSAVTLRIQSLRSLTVGRLSSWQFVWRAAAGISTLALMLHCGTRVNSTVSALYTP